MKEYLPVSVLCLYCLASRPDTEPQFIHVLHSMEAYHHKVEYYFIISVLFLKPFLSHYSGQTWPVFVVCCLIDFSAALFFLFHITDPRPLSLCLFPLSLCRIRRDSTKDLFTQNLPPQSGTAPVS